MCIGEICIELSLELGTILVAAVAGLATWLHHRHHRENFAQRRRHHQDMMAERKVEEKDLRAALPAERELARRL